MLDILLDIGGAHGKDGRQDERIKFAELEGEVTQARQEGEDPHQGVFRLDRSRCAEARLAALKIIGQ
jgi:hypothetical protein